MDKDNLGPKIFLGLILVFLYLSATNMYTDRFNPIRFDLFLDSWARSVVNIRRKNVLLFLSLLRWVWEIKQFGATDNALEILG